MGLLYRQLKVQDAHDNTPMGARTPRKLKKWAFLHHNQSSSYSKQLPSKVYLPRISEDLHLQDVYGFGKTKDYEATGNAWARFTLWAILLQATSSTHPLIHNGFHNN